MRKKGDVTKINCWVCKVINQNDVIYSNEYKTLRQVANDLGLSYSHVTEISAGRRKQPEGRYDTTYILERINKQVSEKLNEDVNAETGEINPNLIYDDDNPSMNGMSQ